MTNTPTGVPALKRKAVRPVARESLPWIPFVLTAVLAAAALHARADEVAPPVDPRYFSLDIDANEAADATNTPAVTEALDAPADDDGWRADFVSLIWLIGI